MWYIGLGIMGSRLLLSCWRRAFVVGDGVSSESSVSEMIVLISDGVRVVGLCLDVQEGRDRGGVIGLHIVEVLPSD